jgi:hypothetical protein
MKITNKFIEQLTTKFVAHIQEYKVTDEIIANFARKIMAIIQEEQRAAVNNERAIQGWLNIENVKSDERKEEACRIDNEFLSKAIMITSGLKGDIWQISKRDWNIIMKRNRQFIEPGELPIGFMVVKKGKSKRVSSFHRNHA